MAKKDWYQSKTIWFAFALELFGAIQLYLPEAREALGEHYGVTLFVVGVIVKLLRFATTKAIAKIDE